MQNPFRDVSDNECEMDGIAKHSSKPCCHVLPRAHQTAHLLLLFSLRRRTPLLCFSLPVESVPPPPSPPPPTSAATAAAETAVPMPPALEVTTLPEPSAATSTNSVPAQDTPSQASPPTPPEGDAADVGVEGTGADTPAAAEEDDDDVLGLQQQERGPAEEDGSSLASSWGSGRGESMLLFWAVAG